MLWEKKRPPLSVFDLPFNVVVVCDVLLCWEGPEGAAVTSGAAADRKRVIYGQVKGRSGEAGGVHQPPWPGRSVPSSGFLPPADASPGRRSPRNGPDRRRLICLIESRSSSLPGSVRRCAAFKDAGSL